jgi:hypothetical protein
MTAKNWIVGTDMMTQFCDRYVNMHTEMERGSIRKRRKSLHALFFYMPREEFILGGMERPHYFGCCWYLSHLSPPAYANTANMAKLPKICLLVSV